MRFIRKTRTAGHALAAAHTSPPQTAGEATRRWRKFRRGKLRVLDQLLEEQYGLCCYSEIRADQAGLGYHIEHVQNKKLYPHRTFDYQNLAVSALSSDDLQELKVQGNEAFGGHAMGKQINYEASLFLSCHQADCPRFFAYLSDGRVLPAGRLEAGDHAKADHTIRQLNLNSPYLVTMRQAWWDELDQLLEQHQTNNWSLPHLVSVDLVPRNTKLSQFFSMTRQFFGPIADQVLNLHAPELL